MSPLGDEGGFGWADRRDAAGTPCLTCPVGFRLIQLAERLLPSAVAGIVTKLPTGWLALQFGLKAVLYRGSGQLIVALLALTRPDPSLSPGAIGCMPGRRNPREATR